MWAHKPRGLRQQKEGSNRQKYITKTVVLHSRFVHIKVKEYYQEIEDKEESTTMCGQLIMFNSFAYAHILMRHYAPRVKFNRPGKTYHDENIDLENLPRHVMFFLDAYEKTLGCAHFNNRSIFFEYKGRNYVIWFAKKSRHQKNQQVQEYLRVQTFYPAELLKDAQQIAAFQKIEANPILSFYY
jgi:hypothetical protein